MLSGMTGHMKASLKNSLPLLHHISRIRPPHHLPQGTLLRMVFSTPPIRQNIFPLSEIREWMLIMTWNYPPRSFLRLTLLILTQFLRDIHGCGMALIAMLWYHIIIMILPSKMAGSPKAVPTSTYSYTVSLSNG